MGLQSLFKTNSQLRGKKTNAFGFVGVLGPLENQQKIMFLDFGGLLDLSNIKKVDVGLLDL